MGSLAAWIKASCIVVFAGIAFGTIRAEADPPNTGMADPVPSSFRN
jgi:hypothetical protein